MSKFQIEENKTIEISGLKVEFRFLSAVVSPTVLARFLSDAGHIVAEYFASADVLFLRDLIMRAMNNEITKESLEGDGLKDIIGEAFESIKGVAEGDGFKGLLDGMQKAEIFDIDAYSKVMIPGIVSIDGKVIESMSHLDDFGASPMIVGRILFESMRFNFGPTLGGGSTKDGSPPEEPSTQEIVVEAMTAKGKTRKGMRTTARGSATVKSKGGKKKAGR